jgi:hypothetical protein
MKGDDWPLLGYTMIGEKRLDNIFQCIQDVEMDQVPGDFMECGVWRGGASIFAKGVFRALGVRRRRVWLADSFEGMPRLVEESDKVDADHSLFNELSVSLEHVRENFQRFGLLDEDVLFIKGWFSDTLPTAPIDHLAVLRLDADHYTSTMDALNALYDKVSPGGYIIVDDYKTFVGCRNAITEFRSRHGVKEVIKDIDSQGVYWRRD